MDALHAWPVRQVAAGAVWRAPGETSTRVTSTGPAGALFPWASVTKLCTALAVLVASEEGVLALDEPAGPPGATVAHLLAHASGLAPDEDRVLAAPGRRRIYSNAGFRQLASLVAGRSGMPFGEYLRAGVLDPLGMAGASGTDLSNQRGHTGVHGSLADLLALGRELLVPRLVPRQTLDRATSVAFPGLAGVLPGYGRQDPCDWGLGFEIRDGKQPHWTGQRNSVRTFGHFGRAGGFLWVDPVADVACAVLTDREFGGWAKEAWPPFSDACLEELRGGCYHPGRV